MKRNSQDFSGSWIVPGFALCFLYLLWHILNTTGLF